MSSEDDKVGYKRPPKQHQFKPGQSGNGRGRPRKPPVALIPSQIDKDTLRTMERKVRVKTPDGYETMTVREASLYALAMNSIKGNSRMMVSWLAKQESALSANITANPEFGLPDTLVRTIIMKGFTPGPETYEMLENLAKKTRRTF